MPGGFAVGDALCGGTSIGVDATNFRGTAVTAGAAVYGSYTQLVASTVGDTNFVIITVGTNGVVNAGYGAGVKIAVGAAGSEVDVIKDIQNHAPASAFVMQNYTFPVAIPAGTRISAAASGNNTADIIYVDIRLFDSNYLPTFSGVDSIGAVGNGSYGTAITAGTTPAKGSYAQLTASTPRDYSCIAFSLTGAIANAGVGLQRGILDIAIGAGGSEQIIIPDWEFFLTNTINSFMGSIVCFPIEIPAATRVAARVSSANTVTVFGLVCYGVYQ